MMPINPEVTQNSLDAAHRQALALLHVAMHKAGVSEISVNADDVHSCMSASDIHITSHEDGKGYTYTVVPRSTEETDQ